MKKPLPFLAFVLNPLVKGVEGLWMAELTPDGKALGNFVHLDVGTFLLKKDQVTLVAYDTEPEGRTFVELRTWTIRHSWVRWLPDRFLPEWLAASPLRMAYRRHKLPLLLDCLYKDYSQPTTDQERFCGGEGGGGGGKDGTVKEVLVGEDVP